MSKRRAKSHWIECRKFGMRHIPPGHVMVLLRGSAFDSLKVYENNGEETVKIVHRNVKDEQAKKKKKTNPPEM